MLVLLNGHDHGPIMEKCKKIFGIQSLSLAVKVGNDLEKIKDAALFALQQGTDVTTFKVSVRRINKYFPVSSQEINQVLGGHLLSNTDGYQVDVHHPDLTVKVEVSQ